MAMDSPCSFIQGIDAKWPMPHMPFGTIRGSASTQGSQDRGAYQQMGDSGGLVCRPAWKKGINPTGFPFEGRILPAPLDHFVAKRRNPKDTGETICNCHLIASTAINDVLQPSRLLAHEHLQNPGGALPPRIQQTPRLDVSSPALPDINIDAKKPRQIKNTHVAIGSRTISGPKTSKHGPKTSKREPKGQPG